MIPLRDATYRSYQYTLKLKGSAINGTEPYEIHFDTGSWTTSLPGGALDLSKITILESNVSDPWGVLSDKVSGQLIVESVDGTQYILDNYIFYARKNSATGQYLPDDRGRAWGNSIMGAFPSKDPGRAMPSFPYALTEKYASADQGMGIVSNCLNDINTEWNALKSYLMIGNNNNIVDKLSWRSDIANFHGTQEFQPEATPGFKITIKFPDVTNSIVVDNLIATIDTGAPDLTMKLGSSDPQYTSTYSSHFVRDGSWKNWNNQYYNSDATSLINASVQVGFTDDNGVSNSYTFPVGSDPYHGPNSLFAGRWGSGVPWVVSSPSMPSNRINLGNTIYFYCPVFHFDIKNKRVGLGFRLSASIGSGDNSVGTVTINDIDYITTPALYTQRDCGNVNTEVWSLKQAGTDNYLRHSGWQAQAQLKSELSADLDKSDATFCLYKQSNGKYKVQGRLAADDGSEVDGHFLSADGINFNANNIDAPTYYITSYGQ